MRIYVELQCCICSGRWAKDIVAVNVQVQQLSWLPNSQSFLEHLN